MASPFIERILASIKAISQTATAAGRSAGEAVRTAREAVTAAKNAERVASARGGRGGLSVDVDPRAAQRVSSLVTRTVSALNRISAVGNTFSQLIAPDPNQSTFRSTLSLIQQAGPAAGPAGLIAAAVASGLKAIDTKAEEAKKKLDSLAQELRDRRIREADDEARFAEDPRFRREQEDAARRIYYEQTRNEALRGSWDPRSSALGDGVDW